MNKNILGGLAIAAFNLNFDTKDNRLLEISLANVEALAGPKTILDYYIWMVIILLIIHSI